MTLPKRAGFSEDAPSKRSKPSPSSSSAIPPIPSSSSSAIPSSSSSAIPSSARFSSSTIPSSAIPSSTIPSSAIPSSAIPSSAIPSSSATPSSSNPATSSSSDPDDFDEIHDLNISDDDSDDFEVRDLDYTPGGLSSDRSHLSDQITRLLSAFDQWRSKNPMKGFSEIQQDVQNELGDRVVEVVFEGLRSEKIIEEIRRTGTLSRDSIKGGDLISVPEEWNRAGVYADLGEKGREMRRRSELYVGSAAALKAHYEAGLGPLVGLANRVFNGHERFSFRQQYPKNLHYKRGYTKDVPHTYICLWTLPDVAIAGHIGYPTVPSKGEEGYQVYREKRQALITLVEAILIRLLGCHYYKEFDRMAEEQHGFQKCKLVPFPLNRAFALEKCGGAWFTTETGRAAGQKGHGVLKGRWIEELGLEKGADISISQVLRKRKGDQYITDLGKKAAKVTLDGNLRKIKTEMIGSGFKRVARNKEGLVLTKSLHIIEAVKESPIPGMRMELIPNANIRARYPDGDEVSDGTPLFWTIRNWEGFEPDQLEIVGATREGVVKVQMTLAKMHASWSAKQTDLTHEEKFRIFVKALDIIYNESA